MVLVDRMQRLREMQRTRFRQLVFFVQDVQNAVASSLDQV